MLKKSSAILGGMILAVTASIAQMSSPSEPESKHDFYLTLTNYFGAGSHSVKTNPVSANDWSIVQTGQLGAAEISLTNYSGTYTGSVTLAGRSRPRDMGEYIVILLGTNAAFSATASLVTPASAGIVRHIVMRCSFGDGKARTETDIHRIGKAGAGQPKPVIVISIPAEDRAIYLSPGAQTYYPVDSTDLLGLRPGKPVVLKHAQLGEEMLDGRRCLKYEVIVQEATGNQLAALIWEAPEFHHTPLKMIFGNTTIRFTDIVLTNPPAALFEVPPGYKKLSSIEQVFESATGQ